MIDHKKAILDLKRNKEERIQSAFKLENSPEIESINALGQALFTDPSPIVRHECAFALGETAAPKIAGHYLMKAIENDPSIFVKHEALLALATLGDKNFKPFIEKYVKDKNPDIAESAEIAIQRLEFTDHQ